MRTDRSCEAPRAPTVPDDERRAPAVARSRPDSLLARARGCAGGGDGSTPTTVTGPPTTPTTPKAGLVTDCLGRSPARRRSPVCRTIRSVGTGEASRIDMGRLDLVAETGASQVRVDLSWAAVATTEAGKGLRSRQIPPTTGPATAASSTGPRTVGSRSSSPSTDPRLGRLDPARDPPTRVPRPRPAPRAPRLRRVRGGPRAQATPPRASCGGRRGTSRTSRSSCSPSRWIATASS